MCVVKKHSGQRDSPEAHARNGHRQQAQRHETPPSTWSRRTTTPGEPPHPRGGPGHRVDPSSASAAGPGSIASLPPSGARSRTPRRSGVRPGGLGAGAPAPALGRAGKPHSRTAPSGSTRSKTNRHTLKPPPRSSPRSKATPPPRSSRSRPTRAEPRHTPRTRAPHRARTATTHRAPSRRRRRAAGWRDNGPSRLKSDRPSRRCQGENPRISRAQTPCATGPA